MSLFLGITFAVVGALNVIFILQASRRAKDPRWIAAHRIGGYLFIALFCVMAYSMAARFRGADASPAAMVHMTLATLLVPLLFIKVIVARYYKSYSSVLLPLGLGIFVVSFVMIAITAGPHLAAVSGAPSVDPATALVEKRCSKCHTLDRVFGARKDARGWLATVNRMRAMRDSGISEADARMIVSFLALQTAPEQTAARALVDQRCGRCHSLDRVYKTAASPEEWRQTVARMAGYAEGSAGALQPGEERQIADFLSVAQTPEAIEQRKSRVTPASTGPAALPILNAPGDKRYDPKAIIFVSLVCIGALALIVRRPRQPLVTSTPPPPSPAGAPLVLRLVRISQQTPDARTLRFIVTEGRQLGARPGQFLTFSFLFDGKKVVRSYSICSSPARAGYVEITPKRADRGCVSVFLNDRAAAGLTVEAKGPFGQFYFDETRHKSVVLIAAGSGITPFMAMLRYMDDLCLETNATLLYCVRTADDIFFASELEALRKSLRNFSYRVLLSQTQGRISDEFVLGAVQDLNSSDFFVCGPAAFMDAARSILADLGVTPERIHQESFGSPKAVHAGGESFVEFVRSGKSCATRAGQTLLEAAEEQGVAIPFSCRQGQCGTCKTRLIEGTVTMDAEQGLDSESKARGFVLTCVGRATSAVKLDV